MRIASRLRVVAFVAAFVLVGACTASTGGSTQHGSRPASCTWGASSVTAIYADGKVVVSGPDTTGCAEPIADSSVDGFR